MSDDDDRVEQVLAAMAPTPASEVAWPVSRRTALRALAALGLVGATGSASAQSVGTVRADTAVFSNYGSEATPDGYAITIDDTTFTLGGGDLTLPEGTAASEVATPDSGVSDIVGPDGNVLFEDRPDIPDGTVDNFEAVDASLPGVYETGQTLADYYSGATGSWARTTSNVVQGAHALEKTSASIFDHIYSVPGDGLNEYPSEGDTIIWLAKTATSASTNEISPGPIVAASSGVDGYLYSWSIKNSDIRIWRLDGGSYTQLNTASASLSDDTWHWCEARVPSSSDGSLTYTVYQLNTTDLTRGAEVATISTTDTNYVSRGIGWSNSTNNTTGTVADWLHIK